jgi:hypothetical protein
MTKRVTDGSILFEDCVNSKTSQTVLNLNGHIYPRENRFCLKNHETCDGKECPDWGEKKKSKYQIKKEKERDKFGKWLGGWEKNIKGEKQGE